MIINTNVSSITAQEAATNTGKSIKSSLEKLSTGLKINKASDDASGLAIADKLRTQATSIDQGIANGNSAVTLLQIADKSMAEQSNILDTVKAKLIQANTDTTSADGRESIRKDISKLLEQLDNIAEQTNYNGNVLLQASAGDTAADKAFSTALSFQIGETNADIINNTSIQSNTSGLGSQTVYSAENENDSIASGDTTTVGSTGTISLTSTNVSGENSAESISLSGDVDTLALKTGMTISGMDAVTKTAFETALTLNTDYTQAGNTYTMLTDQSLDLSSNNAVTANITTVAEAAGSYAPEAGDVIDATSVTDGSALATALSVAANFADNGDGTYTVTTAGAAAGAISLQAGESLDFERATTEQALTAGQTLTLGADLVANSELSNALSGLTPATGTAGESGATYLLTTTETVGIDAAESITLTTPGTTAGPINLTTAVGDMFTLNADVVANSALATALADNTLFERITTGTAGAAGEVYKALTTDATGIALSEGEDVSKAAATTVNIGQGGAFPAGSTLTLDAVPVAGSDLANQLEVAADKFTYVSGGTGAGTVGAVYTVKDNFTSDNVKLVEGEEITMTAAATVASPVTSVANNTIIDDATMTFTPDGGSAVALNVSATGVVEDDSAAGTAYQIGTRGVLEFDVVAATDADTFNALAGDTIEITVDATTNGVATSNQIIENANWIDNGDGSYTAIADQTITLDDATDALNVKRTIGDSLTTTSAVGSAATDVSRVSTSATTTPAINGATNTTGTVAPSSTVAVDFTTDTTVDVTNNGGATDTLTMSSTAQMSNGGTQLSELADVTSGNLTSELASTFQSVVDDAITDLNGFRGDIGSTQNQVESAVRNLMTQSTNVQAAESIIRDVDYAAESANFNKQNIISQAGSYAISQANSVQQNVLKLLQ